MLGRLRHRDATTTATELPPGTPRILLIDDDPDEAEIVRDSLERAGAFYRVENASPRRTGWSASPKAATRPRSSTIDSGNGAGSTSCARHTSRAGTRR